MDESTSKNSETPPNQEPVEVPPNGSVSEPAEAVNETFGQNAPAWQAADDAQMAEAIASQSDGVVDPEFVNGQFYSLDPRNITVESTVKMISAAVVSISGVVGLVFVWMSLGFGWLFWSLVAAAFLIMALLFLAAYFWPRIDYRHTSFRIDSLGIEIRQGVWWRHQVAVPIGRVQHADVSQGPIQRMNGVASLTLHTAGTSNASVAIDGLAHQFAIDIRDWIVHQRKSQDAV